MDLFLHLISRFKNEMTKISSRHSQSHLIVVMMTLKASVVISFNSAGEKGFRKYF